MRCSRHHYFHRGCLQEWIRVARRNQGGATCPLCRGPLQVHADRLRAFLNGEGSSQDTATLDSEETTFFEQILGSMRESTGGWVDLKREDIMKFGAITAAAGWGFYSGWTGRSWTIADELMYSAAAQHSRIAVSVGWFAGTISKMVVTSWSSSSSSSKRDKEKERR